MFPPSLQELPPPNLELFDLDDEFASEKTRLAQLTNKCTPVVVASTLLIPLGMDNDLEYYIRECGSILGIAEKLPPNERTPQRILTTAIRQLVNWKMLNPQML